LLIDTGWPGHNGRDADRIAAAAGKAGISKIDFLLLTHFHQDHAGGAKYLQEHFGARVIMSAADWDLIEHDTAPWSKPKRDMTAIDGQKVTLGDTTLTMYLTPGHTLGTISTLIPVRDNGKPHVAAEWGGTLFNWLTNRRAYITAGRPDRFWFETYVNSARRFRDIVAKAGVDVIISNCVINLSADKDRVLSEAFRVLKPGGRFAVSDVVVRGEVPAAIRRSVELWIGCVAGALEEQEYRDKLAKAGFAGVDVEPTRVYRVEDARDFLAGSGIDADAIAPQVDGKFMSAFVRARKPIAG
jgi:SAM-dependent methyltransferase